MRRVFLIALLIGINLTWQSGAAAQDTLPTPNVSLRVSQTPGDDLTPQLAVSASGRALLAWKHTAPERDSAAVVKAPTTSMR